MPPLSRLTIEYTFPHADSRLDGRCTRPSPLDADDDQSRQPPAPPAATALSNDFTPTVSSSAQAKVNTVRALLAGHTDRKEEKQILALFKGASKAELNQLITALSRKEMHELISDLDDRLLGPDHKTAFVELISKDRVGDLTVDARGMFIQASARARPGRTADLRAALIPARCSTSSRAG